MALFKIFVLTIFCFSIINGLSDKNKIGKKDIRDYTEADLEKLYDQWEEDEEPLEEDELPEYKRPKPKIDLSSYDPNDPESFLRQSKKGQSLMLFATIAGESNRRRAEEVSSYWQSALHNMHIDVKRYVIDEDRILFMIEDGSRAWEIKDFLVTLDTCFEVQIEGKSYPGKGSPDYKRKEEL